LRPFRYTFIVGLVGFATVLAAFGGWRYARASAPVNGPIILVSIDSVRADRLPIYGYRDVRTPAIDALAADGIVFDRAYAHVPQTLPAHTALLTGRLPVETGVRDETAVVGPRERLVAEMLRDRGYATGAIVSSFALRRETGIARGFTFFDDDLNPPSDIGAGLWRSGAASVEEAERWLEQTTDSRVFLFLHLYEPHLSRVLDTATEDEAYDTQVAQADALVGRLVRFLKSHQLYDSSTIILVSDHGEGLGDHGEQGHGLFVFEEALRVPLIVKQAAGEGAGRRVDESVQHLDLVPTLLDLAKAPRPDNLQGRSLKPVLDGTQSLPRRIIYSESLYGRNHFGWSPQFTLTDGRFRYIKGAAEELYDVEADPAARRNIASESNLREWQTRLKQYAAGPNTPDRATPTSDHLRRQLSAVGHVDGYPASLPEHVTDRHHERETIDLVETKRSAEELATARRWSEAIAVVQSGLRRHPASADLTSQLAALFSRSGRDEDALSAYRRLIARRPSDAVARLGAAEALFRLRRYDEARQHATVVAEAHEDVRTQAAAHALIAEIALARGEPERARRAGALRTRFDSSPFFSDYVEARLLYDRGRVADALPLLEAIVVGARESGGAPMPNLHYYTGAALAELGRDAEATKHFLSELEASPGHTPARASLAAIRYRNGDVEEALADVSAIMASTPTLEGYRLAARLFESFGELERAASARADARRLAAADTVLHSAKTIRY
jgi:tetratricopeptide (TPR) repeat protein